MTDWLTDSTHWMRLITDCITNYSPAFSEERLVRPAQVPAERISTSLFVRACTSNRQRQRQLETFSESSFWKTKPTFIAHFHSFDDAIVLDQTELNSPEKLHVFCMHWDQQTHSCSLGLSVWPFTPLPAKWGDMIPTTVRWPLLKTCLAPLCLSVIQKPTFAQLSVSHFSGFTLLPFVRSNHIQREHSILVTCCNFQFPIIWKLFSVSCSSMMFFCLLWIARLHCCALCQDTPPLLQTAQCCIQCTSHLHLASNGNVHIMLWHCVNKISIALLSSCLASNTSWSSDLYHSQPPLKLPSWQLCQSQWLNFISLFSVSTHFAKFLKNHLLQCHHISAACSWVLSQCSLQPCIFNQTMLSQCPLQHFKNTSTTIQQHFNNTSTTIQQCFSCSGDALHSLALDAQLWLHESGRVNHNDDVYTLHNRQTSGNTMNCNSLKGLFCWNLDVQQAMRTEDSSLKAFSSKRVTWQSWAVFVLQSEQIVGGWLLCHTQSDGSQKKGWVVQQPLTCSFNGWFLFLVTVCIASIFCACMVCLCSWSIHGWLASEFWSTVHSAICSCQLAVHHGCHFHVCKCWCRCSNHCNSQVHSC